MRLAALVLLAAGCGGGARRDPVADAIAAGLAAQLGVGVARVRCSAGGCDATLAGGSTVRIHLAGERELAWESEDVALTAALAVRIRDELAGLGLAPAIDCGPARVVAPGAPVRCELAGGGAAWARIGADGEVVLEVATTPAIVRARTEPTDERGLEARSRALDSDEAQGVPSDDDPELDAGAPDRDGGPGDGGT